VQILCRVLCASFIGFFFSTVFFCTGKSDGFLGQWRSAATVRLHENASKWWTLLSPKQDQHQSINRRQNLKKNLLPRLDGRKPLKYECKSIENLARIGT